jgi:hypothetical protein
MTIIDQAEAKFMEFLEDYKQMPNRVYTILSGSYFMASSNKLEGIRKRIVKDMKYGLIEENGVIMNEDDEEETSENLFNSISPFGDIKLVITKKLDLTKPIYINYSGNYRFHNISHEKEKYCTKLIVE